MPARAWFPTLIYEAPLLARGGAKLTRMLLEECLQVRDADGDGRDWCAANYPGGYTSYGSLDKLHRMSSTFMRLRDEIDRHVASFARSLQYDLDGRSLEMTDCWVNVMPRGCTHGLHLHPTSTISGTYYVQTPRGCSALRFEDPRLPMLMAAPPRKARVALFESWLRHEVPPSRVDAERVSIRFTYGWF